MPTISAVAHGASAPCCSRASIPFPSASAQKAMPSRPFQTRPTQPPQPTVRRPAQAASTPAPPRFQTYPRPASSNALLANRTLFRITLFVLPFLSAAIGLLLVPSSNLSALLLLRNTWLLAAGLGIARRIQLRRYAQALSILVPWLAFYYVIANLLGASSVSGALSRSLAEAGMAFLASRSLLQLMRLRMDHYRLIGRTGRISAVLVTAAGIAPLAALTEGVTSLATSAAASTAVRALTSRQTTLSPQVTLSTCANLVGRCGCAPRTAFHRGETVSLLALKPRDAGPEHSGRTVR